MFRKRSSSSRARIQLEAGTFAEYVPVLVIRFLSWLYAHRPDGALKVRIARLLEAATFVQAYRPGAATLLWALHAAGLNAAGLTRVTTVGILLLTSENDKAARRALAAGDLAQLPAWAETFDINPDYVHVLLLTHARGSFAGLYYMPLEFNANVDKLQTVWLTPWSGAQPFEGGPESVAFGRNTSAATLG